MTIERSDNQQTTCNACAIINGERRQVASATCSIRPGNAMNVSIDLMDDVELTSQDIADIATIFAGYLAGEIDKAAGLGIPIALPKR